MFGGISRQRGSPSRRNLGMEGKRSGWRRGFEGNRLPLVGRGAGVGGGRTVSPLNPSPTPEQPPPAPTPPHKGEGRAQDRSPSSAQASPEHVRRMPSSSAVAT